MCNSVVNLLIVILVVHDHGQRGCDMTCRYDQRGWFRSDFCNRFGFGLGNSYNRQFRHRVFALQWQIVVLFRRRQGVVHLGFQNLPQLGQHVLAGLFEETRSKLVQQPANVVGRSHKRLSLLFGAPRLQLHVLKGMLQNTRQL
ncbi:hypothetical protein D3C72_1682230 [compost metagenome]